MVKRMSPNAPVTVKMEAKIEQVAPHLLLTWMRWPLCRSHLSTPKVIPNNVTVMAEPVMKSGLPQSEVPVSLM